MNRKIAAMPAFYLALFDIAQFPTALQPMIQQGYLETEFESYLEANNGYWENADSSLFTQEFEKNRGTTITETRPGLKAPVQLAVDNTAAQTGPNDGVTPSDFAIEQYTFSPFEMTDGADMDLIGTNFAIVNRFNHYIANNSKQPIQSVDLVARNTFIAGYAVGAAVVTTGHATGSSVPVSVDDIRGLDTVISLGASSTNGVVLPVSTTHRLPATVYPAGGLAGAFSVDIELAAADGSNTTDFVVNGAPAGARCNGISGVVTIQTLGTAISAGDVIVAGDAPVQYVGASGKTHWSKLVTGDANLASVMLLDAVGNMRNNAVPFASNDNGEDEGTYCAHVAPSVLRSLYNDSDFKQANQTLGQSKIYKRGKVSEYLGVTFKENTNAPKIPLAGGGFANLTIVTGQGAIIDKAYAGLEDWVSSAFNPTYVTLNKGIAQILSPAYRDRQGRKMGIDWLTIRDMVAPTDVTRSSVVLTGSGSRRARAVCLWTYSAT